MPRMIELIRESKVPAQVMRSAVLGSLSLPPAEMIEILVFLTRNPVFGKQARMTLAGWDEAASISVAGDPQTPPEVLDYLLARQNRRPCLLPALVENPSVPEIALLEMAHEDSRELVEVLLTSARVRRSADVLHVLVENPHLTQEEAEQTRQTLNELQTGEGAEPAQGTDVLEVTLAQYQAEHAAEIAAEETQPFELVDATADEHLEVGTAPVAAAAAAPAPKKKPEPGERLSVLQKIARLTVGERVQLAMKGSRDERFILIRDGSKVVSAAVLESPKVSEQEIESFAAMKNVQESVLRGIAGKRKFMKAYAVVRALVNNPRCPLDVALSLMKNLLVGDLRNLSMNKNVADTVRKVALKMYKEKASNKRGE